MNTIYLTNLYLLNKSPKRFANRKINNEMQYDYSPVFMLSRVRK